MDTNDPTNATMTALNSVQTIEILRSANPAMRTTMPELGEFLGGMVGEDAVILGAHDANEPDCLYRVEVPRTAFNDLPGANIDQKMVSAIRRLNGSIKGVFN